MSRFNEYARRADKIAKAAFEEYRKAQAALEKAEAKAREYPQRGGMVSADYAAKAARAHADLLEAKEAMRKARDAFDGQRVEIEKIGKELAAAVADAYTVDPAQIDGATLELLKSGIMKPAEYSKLLASAQNSGNHTMARLVCKYAGDAAGEIAKKFGDNDPKAREMRMIAYQNNGNDGSDVTQAYGLLTDVFTRCTRNPGMIDHWDELCGQTVENL